MHRNCRAALLVAACLVAAACAATPPAPSLTATRRASLLAKRSPPPAPPVPVAPPAPPPHKATNSLLRCVGIVTVRITAATLIYSKSEGWPLAQSLFFAVDTGMSIGFGAVAEEKLSTKLFTVFHVLLGASAISGAIALFADSVIAESAGVAASEYSAAALEQAFREADKDGSNSLSASELGQTLAKFGLTLSPAELDAAVSRFDTNNDGTVSTSEFLAAVTPLLPSCDTMESAILAAADRCGRSWLETAARRLLAFLVDKRTLVLWAVWVFGGAAWAAATEGYDPITALYFAVGGLSTGGLQAPALDASGVLPDKSATFVALWCLTGIPIFGMALGQFANLFVQRSLSARERAAIRRPITADEYSFAQSLFNADGKVDLSEFIALELLRLGKVDMTTLRMITAEFNRLDRDRSGTLTMIEVLEAHGDD